MLGASVKILDEKLLTRLPYEARRNALLILRPRRKRFFAQMRENDSADSYSFKSFLELKTIFIHIPKCAGISLCRSLFGNLGGGHFKADDYAMAFTEEEFNSFFKFSFVRNPWDRLVSAYEFLRQGGLNDRDKEWAKKNNIADYPGFEEFVMEWLTPNSCNSNLHFIPQYRFVCRSHQLKPSTDFIGYYENLENDFAYVKNRLGISCDLLGENRTKSRSKDYREYYNEDTKNKVAALYSRDIELFGYDFDNTNIANQIELRDSSILK